MPSRRSVIKKLTPLVEEEEISDAESPTPQDQEESDGEEEISDVESPTPEDEGQKSDSEDSSEDEGQKSDSEDSSEDEDHDDPTVELNDGIINITYFDSSDEESDDFDEEEPDLDPDEDEDNSIIDDETEEKFSILTERLEEVAYVIYTGKNSFRINFQNKKGVKLVPKNEDCDFDIDDDGLPIMVDGGENYILPYLVELCKRRSDLKPFQITTNCSKRRYNF